MEDKGLYGALTVQVSAAVVETQKIGFVPKIHQNRRFCHFDLVPIHVA
jgi:hypothetical protein